MLYEKIYQTLPPSRTKNRYQLKVASVDAREENDTHSYPFLFDDLTYVPGGIEFKVKYDGPRGSEEAYCVFIPEKECSGFIFSKNPESDDARQNLRYDRLK